ncbi:MAG: AAA family ATPase [Acidobacteriia bacterium]|nr:AAA family ATPase [Terriglobia bacterium]
MMETNEYLNPMMMGAEAEALHGSLHQRVVGQDDAIAQIVDIYQTYLAGMSSPGRPIGNLLFLGPTGTGKTRLVEATAESLAGDAKAVIKIDCAEFQHSHEIAKLIGSPPGYLGHRETRPALSQQALEEHYTGKVKISFVLFDEIEKASDALWNLMLGILDKATLTLGDNSKVDFSNSIIFMTSNLGAAEMENLLRPKMGFAASEIERQNQLGHLEPGVAEKIVDIGVAAARKKFTPEFMNRIDKVLVFRPLGDAELRRILDIELKFIQSRVQIANPERLFVFSLTQSAKDHLLREGTDVKYGARKLKRTIERALVHPLSSLLASDQVRAGDIVRVDYHTELKRMVFAKEGTMVLGAAA